MTSSSSTFSTSSSSTTSSTSGTANMNIKLRYNKKLVCKNIGFQLDPTTNAKHVPENEIEEWALGLAFKAVYQGANKCLSNASVVEYYEVAHDAVKDYHHAVININKIVVTYQHLLELFSMIIISIISTKQSCRQFLLKLILFLISQIRTSFLLNLLIFPFL